MEKIVYFDLETQHTFQELGMFKGKDKDASKLRMAIGGIVYEEVSPNSIKFETYKFYGENHTNQLLETLNKADLIVGHNLLRFDYKVLQQYFKENILDLLYDKTFDTLIELLPYTDNCWTGLDDLAKLNLGTCKPHSGEKIPKMWTDGLHKEVEDYLRHDLKMTKDFYNFAKEKKRIKYTHKEYGIVIGEREIEVKW